MIRAQHSIFTRLLMGAVALAVALVTALWVMADHSIRTISDERLVRAVDVDLAGLVDIYASGGTAELAARINDRLALTQRDPNQPHYLLARNNSSRIAGDIAAWPSLNARLSQAGRIRLAGGTMVHARATQLAPDLRLLVAREYGDDTALRQQVGLVFLAGGALLVVGVGLLGLFASRRLAGRIATINAAFRNPVTALPARLPRATSPDEIDELASHAAAMLARMQRLVEAHAETSDQIAHELRTPLMHLDNGLVKVLQAATEADRSRRLLDARADIKHAIAMLETLLDIASSKARRGDRHGLKHVDLSAMAHRIADLYADSAEDSGHHFVCDIAAGITLEGEEMQLTRLVTNLLDNAFKYVPSGGTVKLSLRPGPLLIVEDNGPGIPPHARHAVFERFNRGGRPDDDKRGSGLGLALARAIAARHELALTLADTPGGAKFILGPTPSGEPA